MSCDYLLPNTKPMKIFLCIFHIFNEQLCCLTTFCHNFLLYAILDQSALWSGIICWLEFCGLDDYRFLTVLSRKCKKHKYIRSSKEKTPINIDRGLVPSLSCRRYSLEHSLGIIVKMLTEFADPVTNFRHELQSKLINIFTTELLICKFLKFLQNPLRDNLRCITDMNEGAMQTTEITLEGCSCFWLFRHFIPHSIHRFRFPMNRYLWWLIGAIYADRMIIIIMLSCQYFSIGFLELSQRPSHQCNPTKIQSYSSYTTW